MHIVRYGFLYIHRPPYMKPPHQSYVYVASLINNLIKRPPDPSSTLLLDRSILRMHDCSITQAFGRTDAQTNAQNGRRAIARTVVMTNIPSAPPKNDDQSDVGLVISRSSGQCTYAFPICASMHFQFMCNMFADVYPTCCGRAGEWVGGSLVGRAGGRVDGWAGE